MGAIFSFFAVIILVLLAFIGVGAANLHFLFGVIIPYAAFVTFTLGIIYRVIKWARSPVPFRIPTTGGQQKSLPWIKQNKLDNPSSTLGVVGRMALEVLFFRSLFRNTKTELREGPKLAHGSDKWLWLAGIAFHWSFLIILLRHIRLFAEPSPFYLYVLESLDGFLQIGAPRLFMTGIILLLAVTYLFLRRLYIPQVRYISLASDYFPLFLILGIAATGILMRYFFKVNVVGVKELTMGLVNFNPKIPQGIDVIFYIHLFLISVLFAYFPFSKLVHMAGVFLSPTRNLANNNRIVRHINPWNYPVKVHTYEEYEDEFRGKMKQSGIPVEKE
ncbi:MAG: sulfate reduction electron transfer complex DsrMKJOP subunit DsrM [Nitrospirae bacterium]|nr:sulfate reduction electron transfer complex DsrMKJOP subunit DsrM [Nitrospirota bacterium]